MICCAGGSCSKPFVHSLCRYTARSLVISACSSSCSKEAALHRARKALPHETCEFLRLLQSSASLCTSLYSKAPYHIRQNSHW